MEFWEGILNPPISAAKLFGIGPTKYRKSLTALAMSIYKTLQVKYIRIIRK